ncbi:hypothetical protein U1Q18_052074, partial [Sarracenia purpurea var. burkii]
MRSYSNWFFIHFVLLLACNATTEFTCDDGCCILLGYRCDRINDCNDASDERFCKHCTASEFQCATGRNYCIPLEKQCNGIGDCRDHSDEKNCNYSTTDKSRYLSTSTFLFLDESSEKAETNSISPTTDEISVEKFDVFSIPVLQTNESDESTIRAKKSSVITEDDPILQFTEEENQQSNVNKLEDVKSCSVDENYELTIFFASICEGTIKLSNERQLRVRKVISDIIHEMKNEEENPKSYTQ